MSKAQQRTQHDNIESFHQHIVH